ncbi:MAG: GHKL domain-containing protein [Erysipelotrichaceae bacterium]
MIEILFSILDGLEIFLFFYFVNKANVRRSYITIPLVLLFGILNYIISNWTNLYAFNIEFLLFTIDIMMIYLCFKMMNSNEIILLFLLNVISIIEAVGILLVEQYIVLLQFKPVSYAIIIHLIRCITFCLFAKYVKHFIVKYGMKSMSKMFYIMLPLLILLLLLLQGYYIFGSNDYYNVILVASMIVGLSIFVIVKKQYITEVENDKLKMITKIVEYSNDQHATQLDKVKEIRKIKHDMISHLGMIQCLIKEDKSKESFDFISKLIGEISIINTAVFTEYQYLNALLNFKKNLQNDISFDYQIETLQMNQDIEFDCCTIISNLLDNSIDELKRNPSVAQNINLKMKDVNNNIIISVVNETKQFKNLESEKMNPDEHGLGLTIVGTIVKKYNGEIVIEQDSQFKVSLFLRKPYEIDNKMT